MNSVNSIYGSSAKVLKATNVTYPAVWVFTKNSPNGSYKSGLMLDADGLDELIGVLTSARALL